MSPDDEVQITVTRMEAARMHAALKALCDLQRMMPGLPTAMHLTEAVDVIEQVLPRLAACFPAENEVSVSVEQMGADTKSYSEPDIFAVKVDDLRNITPQESAAIFATEYDEAVQALLHTLQHHTDFDKGDFLELLDFTKQLLVETMPVPDGITVQESQPYVKASDLITLGALAFEMYKRQDQIEDKITKPF